MDNLIQYMNITSNSFKIPENQNLQPQGTIARGNRITLETTDPRHFVSSGVSGIQGESTAPTFEDAMLEALNGVNDLQNESSDAIETMLTDPDSIDAHEVTLAMAKANLSLNITRTILDRVVRAWRDLINTR